MKINGIRTIIVDGHRMNWVIVRIDTDAGIHGIGDATVERREQAVAETVKAIGHYLEGQDPFTVDSTWLCVGHVDEWMSWVPDPSARPSSVAGAGEAFADTPAHMRLRVSARSTVRARARGRARGVGLPADFDRVTAISDPTRGGFQLSRTSRSESSRPR